MSLFSTDPQVNALAATVVIFVAAYQLADDTQVVAIGALRGYKDTQVPMWIALFGYWIVAVPIAMLARLRLARRRSRSASTASGPA